MLTGPAALTANHDGCAVSMVHQLGAWECVANRTYGCFNDSLMWVATDSCRGLFQCGNPLRLVGCGWKKLRRTAADSVRCACDQDIESKETKDVLFVLRQHAEIMDTARNHQHLLEKWGGESLVAQYMFRQTPHVVVDLDLLQRIQQHPSFVDAVDLVHMNMTIHRPTLLEEKLKSRVPPAFVFNPSILDHSNMLLKVGTYGRCELGTGLNTNLYRKSSFRDSPRGTDGAPDTPAPDRWVVWLRHRSIHGVFRYVEDARAVRLGGRVHMVFSRKGSGFASRMYLAALEPSYREVLLNYSLMRGQEKNWAPFVYNDTLHLSYSICPHQVLRW